MQFMGMNVRLSILKMHQYTDRYMDVLMDIWMYEHTDGHMNIA